MARKKKDTPIPIKLDESTILDVRNILSLQATLADKSQRIKDEIKEAKAALTKKLGANSAQVNELLKNVHECQEQPEMLEVKQSIVESTEKVLLGA